MTDSKRGTSKLTVRQTDGPSHAPPNGAMGFLWEGGVKTHAFLGGGGVAVLLFLAQLLLPSSPVPSATMVPVIVGILVLSLILTLGHALYVSAKAARLWFDVAQHVEQELEKLEREHGPVTVEAAEKPFHPYNKAKCVLIVRWPNMPFPQGSRVTIAIAQETHERPLGSGTIRPRQFDQKEVVTLDDTYPNVDNLVSAILQPNSEMVKRLRIGPAIDLQNVTSGASLTPDAGESDAMAERQEQ